KSTISSRLLWKPVDFQDWPDFDGAPLPGGDLPRNFDCLVEIGGVDNEEAAQLFASFRERAIGHNALAVVMPNARRCQRGLQGGCRHIFPGHTQFPGVACRVRVALSSLGFG